MSTHVANKPPSTKVTLTDQASLSIDTVNVNKEIPKEVFSKYIPRSFTVLYSNIDPNTYRYELPYYADRDFLNHFNLFIDDLIVERVLIVNQNASQYKITENLNAIELSSTLYQSLDSDSSKIILVYTPV